MNDDDDSSSSSEFVDWIGQQNVDENSDEDCNNNWNGIKNCIGEKLQETELHTTKRSSSSCENSRKKRLVTFNKDWKKTYVWLLEGNNDHQAMCIVCKCQFQISHGGEHDIKRHMDSEKHKYNLQTKPQSSKITDFIMSSSEKTAAAFAECIFVYHSVMHSHSYLSVNCCNNLFSTMFKDSKIASKYKCGRTKATKIVTKVLAPETTNIIKKCLTNDHPFSIATDASNKGNIKTFPLMIRYFKKENGVHSKLLKFYSAKSEKSVDIANALVTYLTDFGLQIHNVTSYCADNAPVNFGKATSVMTALQKLNANIVPVGCICHILHNAGKKAQNLLRFDIETIVIKCYNEFSTRTKKVSELQEFFNFCEEEWSELLRSVPTRWLSLIPAVDRLLLHYRPVKAYFLSQNNPPPLLKLFFEHELAEAYLGFLSNVGSVINKTIAKLESEDTMITELHELLVDLKNSLKVRKDQNYYGSIARSLMQGCDNDIVVNQFQKEANAFLGKTISYIEKWYDFERSKFQFLSIMNLRTTVNVHIDEFSKVASEFNIKISCDLLFEELIQLNKFLEGNQCNGDFEMLRPDLKWVQFFEKNLAPNLQKICEIIFSLPHSNAMTERVFSLMTTAWRKERNKLDIATLEAELMLKCNYKLSCQEFSKYLLQDGKALLLKVQSSEKYL